MKQVNMNGFTRINRTKAKNLFEKGNKVYAVPCNMRPEIQHMITFNNDCGTFEKQENAAEYYNCSTETGKELYFYILDNKTKYYLSADFGETVRLQNVDTGKLVDVRKSEVIQGMKANKIEIMHYTLDPNNEKIIKGYR